MKRVVLFLSLAILALTPLTSLAEDYMNWLDSVLVETQDSPELTRALFTAMYLIDGAKEKAAAGTCTIASLQEWLESSGYCEVFPYFFGVIGVEDWLDYHEYETWTLTLLGPLSSDVYPAQWNTVNLVIGVDEDETILTMELRVLRQEFVTPEEPLQEVYSFTIPIDLTEKAEN